METILLLFVKLLYYSVQTLLILAIFLCLAMIPFDIIWGGIGATEAEMRWHIGKNE